MKLCVIGLGKLGLCTAACFAKAGFTVYGVDINKDLIKSIKSGHPPSYEPGLEDLLKKVKEKLHVTSSFKEGVLNSSVVFIIVPTPSNKEGSFSNKFIVDVLYSISPFIKQMNNFVIVNVVSTVMPLSSEKELIPLLEKLTGKKVGVDIGYVYNPEFIAIGSVIKNFLNPDIVLIGESDAKSGKTVEDVYKKVCENSPFYARTSIINAEIAKLSINCYCTMKISFANFLAELLDSIPHASAKEVTSIIGRDSRIGIKYISPGLGFGGPCFPRDNEAFINFASTLGKDAVLQRAVIDINNRQIRLALDKINRAIDEKQEPVVSLLGLAYKTDTYLTERAQQLEIAKSLVNNKKIKELRVYDPLVKENYGWIECKSLHQCVKDADIIAILTPYPEFLNMSWKFFAKSHCKVINFWG